MSVNATAARGTSDPSTYALVVADTVTVLPLNKSQRRATAEFPSVIVHTRGCPPDLGLVCRKGGLVKNDRLPSEVLSLIFDRLDVISLGRAAQVCKSWSQVAWNVADFGRYRDVVCAATSFPAVYQNVR